MSITNPRTGARVTAQNTTASGTDANITPALPASLVDGDLLVCVDVVFRNLENRSQSSASTPTTPTGWTRKATTVALGGPKTGTGASAYHSSMRLTWYYTRYQSSGTGGVNTAPSIVYGPSAVTTDWHSAQIIAFTGASSTADPTDVLGAFTALDASLAVAAAASTSTLGPATATTATGAGGAAVVALVAEYPLSTGAVPTLAGDSLTWTEASEYGAGGTDAHTLAIDYALLPTAASVTDKSAAVTFGTAAKSIGRMWLIAQDPTAGAAVSMDGASSLTAGATVASSGGAAITAVGTVYTSGGTGTTTLAVTPVTAGNCLVLAMTAYGDGTRTVSSVTGGGATGWTKLAGPHNYTGSLDRQELWLGTVTTAGAATITVTWSNSVASADCHNNAQEFTSGGGPGTTWARDGAGATSNNASSATLTFPALTPSGTGRCYVGRLVTGNVPTAGSQTAGYTMAVDNFTNAYLYKVSVSTAQTPTATQSAASTSGGVAALLTATNFVTYQGAVALTGDTTLTAGGARTAVSAVAMSGAGSLTAAGTYAALPAATMAGATTLTAGVVRNQPGAAVMPAVGSLTAAGTRAVTPTVALAGAGALSATGVAGTSVILAATTTLTAAGTYTALPAVALSGASGLAAATVPARPAGTTLAGSGVLAAGVARTATVAVTLTATTTLVAATSPRAVLAAATTITVGALATRYPVVALAATSSLIARLDLTWLVPTTAGGYSPTPLVGTLGGLTRTVVATAGGFTPYLVRAADHSYSSGVQVSHDTGLVKATVVLAGSAALSVAAGRVAVGAVAMTADSVLVPAAAGAGRATLTATAALSVAGGGLVNPTVALAGVAALTGSGTPLTLPSVGMAATSVLTSDATAGPSVPQNMTAVVASDNSITLTWDALAGATTYKLYEDQSLSGVTGAGALTTTSTVRTPGTSRTYHYWVTAQVGGVETGISNKATAVLPYTAPAAGSSSFKFAFASCINAADSPAFPPMKALTPDYFYMAGDCWYDDGSTDHVAHWNTKFAATNYASMLSTLPNPQIVGWSDHDFAFASNGTGAGNTITSTANTAYRTKFGSSGAGVQGATLASTGIYRTFTLGRVQFILLDERSFKSANTDTDNSSKTMLGSTQKAWVKNLLSTTTAPLVVILGDSPIGGSTTAGDDSWKGYSTERAEMATALNACPVPVIRMSGDMHCLAYAHDKYGYNRAWQAAPLNNLTKVKAGGEDLTATYPTNANEGSLGYQFGMVTFVDDSSQIVATFRGYTSDGTQRLSDSLTVGAPSSGGGGGGTGGTPANVLRIDGVNGGTGGFWNEGIGFHSGDPEGSSHVDISYSSIAGGYTRDPYFKTTADGSAVQFQVFCDGAKTSTNTHYPRSELRELQSDGSTMASWSGSSGTHTMSGTTRVMHGVPARDKVVIAQIHDGSQDTLQIAVDGTDVTLSIIGVQKGTMLAGVSKGTWFDWEAKVTNGQVTVKINGVQKYNSNPGYGSGQYFKTGCYAQAASGYTSGVSASDYFTIELKNLATSHA